jgi:PAS domain S-box-containing protein
MSTEAPHPARRWEKAPATELAGAKELLEATEARFEAVFEQAAVGMALVAPDGRLLRVNQKLCDIVGYTLEELLACSFQDITHPEDLSSDLEFVQRMLDRKLDTYSMEKRYLRKGGRVVWVNLTVALTWTADGNPDFFISIVEDIQDRKEAQAALKATEATLREARRLAGLGHWHWDLQTGTHTWSEEIYRLYGRNPALPPAVYPEVQQYFTQESWAALAAAVDRGTAEGASYTCDAEVVRPDGTHCWIQARGHTLLDGDGNPSSMYGTVHDITERKQAELALRESEATYRSLFDHMLNGFAHCRMAFVDGWPSDYLYLNVNAAFETLTGLRDVAGRWVSEVIPGIREADPRLFEICGRVAKGGPPEQFEIYLEALGMWFSISVYCPRLDHFVAVFDVITKRKQAEQEIFQLTQDLERRVQERTAALNDLSAYNRSLLEASLDPLVTIGMDGRIQDVNEAIVKATGVVRGELIGSDFSTYFTEPDNAKAGYEKVFAEGVVRDYELSIKHRDGGACRSSTMPPSIATRLARSEGFSRRPGISPTG